MKKKYIVQVREVHVSSRVVYATSPVDAIQEVENENDEEEIACEYSHTLDSDTWSVQDHALALKDKTFQDLRNLIPGSEMGKDNDGQLVIYTGYQKGKDGTLEPYDPDE